MALGPQLPEASHRGEKRMLDRAVFLGDLGRTVKTSETSSQEAGKNNPFRLLLDEEIDEPEEVAQEDRDLLEAGDDPAAAEAAGNSPVKDDQLENRKDADRLAVQGGAEMAERATASNHGLWRGPQLNLGAAMVSVPQQLQAQEVEKQGRTQKQRDAGDGEKLEESKQQVDDALLQALRQSGLAHPVTGFSDPRLKSGPPQLGPEWSVKGTVYRWEASPGQRQVLRWSDKESLLETTAAGQRQVIQKLGDQFWSQTTPWDSEGAVHFT